MKRRTTIFLNLALASLVALVIAAGLMTTGSAEESAEEPSTTTVRTGDVTQSVSAAGTVEAPEELAVSFETGGELLEVAVKVGDTVEEGDVLGKVDPTDAERSLESAQTGLVSAQSQLAQTLQTLTPAEQAQQQVEAEQAVMQTSQAQESLTYTEQLTALNAQTYQTQVDQARAALSRADNDLASAEDDLVEAEDQLATDEDADEPDNVIEADEQTADQAEQAVDQAADAVTRADEQVVAAIENQATSLLRDQQSLAQARQQVESAQTQETTGAAQRSVQAEAPQDFLVASAQASVDKAELEVASAQESLDDAVLHAPVGGLITAVNGSVGGQAGATSGSSSSTSSATGAASSSTSSTSSSSSFVTIVPATGLAVTAAFAEVDAIEIDPGQPVIVTFDALPDVTVDASVTSVSPTAAVTDNVVTYEVSVLIEDVPEGVRSGMSATIEVIVGEATGVLTLPSSAITTVGDTSTVTVVRGEEQEAVTVEVGLRGSGSVEISGDIEEGDEVVLATGSATGLAGAGDSPFGDGGPPGGGGLGGGGGLP